MEFQWAEVERITGVKRIRLHQWIEAGFITPSLQVAKGSGSRHIWSKTDLYNIILFKRLVESGIHRNTAAKLIPNVGFDDINKIYRPEKERGGPGEVWLVIARRWGNGQDEGVESFAYPWIHGELKNNLADVLGEINEDRGWNDAIIINVTKLAEYVDSCI